MSNNLNALLIFPSKSPGQKSSLVAEKEQEELINIFLKLMQDNRLKLLEEVEDTSKDLSQRIAFIQNQQVLLHIGVHANVEALLGADGTSYVQGICKTIELSKIDLLLAFINGSSSLGQVERYLKIGAKVVIVTNLVDEDAKDFALWFYECLSQRYSIEQAFEKACALLRHRGYPFDSFNDLKIATRGSRSKDYDDDNKLPWKLVYQEENREYLGWKIPLVPERLTSWSKNTALEVIGRETEIKHLHSRLKDKNRVVVHGLAGMGKSALARDTSDNMKVSTSTPFGSIRMGPSKAPWLGMQICVKNSN